MRDLTRLLRPRSIALFGGGWAENVAWQLHRAGYQGTVYAVHPTRARLGPYDCVASIEDLPEAPDASFVGVNRAATIDVIAQLAEMGAGGAICFASGFKESDLADGFDLQQQLCDQAGDMPVLGPNCYGLINYLDNAPLWPDEHGGRVVTSGAAIIAQSSNIAINMTMQQRGLKLAYMVTLGNQAQTQVSDMIDALCDDDRVTCIGLYLEGFGDIEKLHESVAKARAVGKPIIALKIGKTEKARLATQTHTASLAGQAAAASALLQRLGIAEVNTISELLETLKLLDGLGPLSSAGVASVSCSGGEASLMSDLAAGTVLEFDEFVPSVKTALSETLGPKVTVANPLDYHTYIWGDIETMTQCFSHVLSAGASITVFVLDLPRADRCDPAGHECAVQAICAAKQIHADAAIAVISTLSENLSEAVIDRFATAGIVTLNGMKTGVMAIDAAIRSARLMASAASVKPLLAHSLDVDGSGDVLDESQAKAVLADYGVPVPSRCVALEAQTLLEKVASVPAPVPAPWAVKALGIAHKTEQQAVALNVRDVDELKACLRDLPHTKEGYLLEAFVTDAVAELLVGVNRDATGVYLLTIGAGGVMTELLADTVSLVLPITEPQLEQALTQLKLYPVLTGYRGQAGANTQALIDAIMAIAKAAQAQADRLLSLDVNPLLVTPERAVAVDALLECLPSA